MFDKLLIWTGHVLMGSVLVLIASQQSVFAQDEAPEPAGESTPAEESTPLEESTPIEESTQIEVIGPSGKVSVPLSGMGQAVRIGNLSATPDTISLGLVEIGETINTAVELSHQKIGWIDARCRGGLRALCHTFGG